MYDYIAVRFNISPCNEDITDLLAAFLAEDEYETFEPDQHGLTAYIRKDKYKKEFLDTIINNFPFDVNFKIEEEEIVGEDWNKEWELNYFKPIRIGENLVIRSSFHDTYEKAPIEILIDPKMAFGTGHHATTSGMSKMLLEENMEGKTVIDMGTGTGILSILSKKLGSGKTVGIDIDEFAIENAIENGNLNNVEIDWKVGDEKILKELESSEIFLANINLNVITSHLEDYIKKIKPGGKIFLSGFLNTDREDILKIAESFKLKLYKESSENGWMVMVFIV